MNTRQKRLAVRAVAAGMILAGTLVVAVLDQSRVPARAADNSAAEEWKAPARAARKKNPIPPDEKSLAAGKAVYAKECASCHGDAGKGDGE